MTSEPRTGRLIWSRMIWRYWLKEAKLTAMLVGILALGIAVFLSVRLANKAAVTGFGLFTESIVGQSDFILRSPAGKLDERILLEIRKATGSAPLGIFPVLEVTGAIADDPEPGLLRLVGVDLVGLQNAAQYLEGESAGSGGNGLNGESTNQLLGSSRAVFVGQGFVGKTGVAAGETVSVTVSDRVRELVIEAVLPDSPNVAAVPANLVLMDLPGLQALSGEAEKISRVELRIPPGADAAANRESGFALLTAFAEANDLILETPEEQKSSVTQMSAAFRLNLTILSGLALLVGVYLIMQAMEASVVKRRAEIAVMRSLGVTPAEIKRAWILEALLLGFAGSVLGIVLGRILAMGMVGAIAGTVNTLYYETTTTAVTLGGWEVLFCLVFGTVASVLAGWIPARDAAATPPAQAMRHGARSGGLKVLRFWPVGIVLFIAGIAAAALPPWERASGSVVSVGGYLSSILLVLSSSVLIGLLFRPVSRLLGRVGKRSAPFRYAASQLRKPGGRHRLTAAGLAAAIGMSAAMAILVASFETTLTSWIQQLLKADLYVSAPGISSVTNENTISSSTWKAIDSIDGVAGMDRLRRYPVSIDGTRAFLGGADYNQDSERHLQLIWLDPPEDRGPDALEKISGGVISGWISEPFQRIFGVGKGDLFTVPTPQGAKEIRCEGVYAEYGGETGTVMVSRKFTSEWFSDDRITQMSVYVSEGIDPEVVLSEIESQFPTLVARTNARLREESLRIFHQTFAVTYALEAIAVLIAVAGLGLALAGLLLERRRELITLKSLGATRREIAAAAMWEGVGLSIVGLSGGILLSFALGWVLIHVINPQSFGWTLTYQIPWGAFAFLIGVTILCAAVVASAVGYRNGEVRSDRIVGR
ncbi:MAG: FtsX-like permease family protein [Verrucomicrobiales bacterium]|nr:FtsX-like permease family protein [Verrucomicrobiales bacterium]